MRAETGIGEVRNCPSPTYCNSPSAETVTVKRKLIVIRIVLDLPRPMQVVISTKTIAADAAFGHDLARLATDVIEPRPESRRKSARKHARAAPPKSKPLLVLRVTRANRE